MLRARPDADGREGLAFAAAAVGAGSEGARQGSRVAAASRRTQEQERPARGPRARPVDPAALHAGARGRRRNVLERRVHGQGPRVLAVRAEPRRALLLRASRLAAVRARRTWV